MGMLVYSRHRTIYRFFCSLVLVLVLPGFLQLGILISPAAWAATAADEKSSQLNPLQLALLDQLLVDTVAKKKDSPAEPIAPTDTMVLAKASPSPIQDRTVNVTTPAYWTRVARLLPESEKASTQDLDQILAKAYTVRSPKAPTTVPDLRRYRPDAPDNAAPSEPTATEDTSQTAEPATAAATDMPGPSVATSTDADTTVRQGDAFLEANRLREAAHQYFTVVNEWPDSPESASCDSVMNALAWDVERNMVDLAELRQFTDELPAAESCKSDKAVYWVVAAQQMAGENLAKAGLKKEAWAYLERGRDAALTAMRQMPESPQQVFLPAHYLRACRIMGKTELGEAVENLESVIRAQKTPNLLKFAARVELAMSYHKDHNDVTEGLLQCGNLLDELAGSEAERVMADDTAATANIRAHVSFCTAYVQYQTSHFGAARRIYDGIVARYPENQRMVEASMYMSAFLTELLEINNPQAGIDAYMAYAAKSQGGDFLAMAFARLAGIYDRAGQLTQAAQVLRRSAELYPGKEWRSTVAEAAQEREAAVKAGMEEKTRAERLRGTQGESLCGPFALALLLESRGISADIMTLAQQAGSDTNGTNLFGLRKAAGIFGVSLRAIRTGDATDVPVPAIAYMEPNHFVFVRAADESGITIEDVSGQRSMKPDDFLIACPRLLALSDAAGDAAEMAQEEMEAVRGACDDFFEDLQDYYLSCINQTYVPECPTCDNGEAAKAQSCSKGNSLSAGDGGISPIAMYGAMSDNGSGSMQPQMPFNRSGVSLGTTTTHRAITIRQADVSVSTASSLNLEFRRFYKNSWGFHSAYTMTEARPFKNNIGSGWTHNLNVHVRLSTTNGYAFYIDAYGNTKQVERTTQNQNGYDLYTPTPFDADGTDTNALTRERAVVFRRSVANGWFEIIYPDGNTSRFSAPINDEERYCRMESFKDQSGNQFNLTYQDCFVPTPTDADPNLVTNFGRLSRIDAPSGDGRHLAFTYTGNRIASVALRDSSNSVLKHADFGYGVFHPLQQGETDLYGANFLRSTQVDDNTNDTVAYEYDDGVYNQQPYGMYPSKITDKAGNQLLIACTYSQIYGEQSATPTTVTLTHPDGTTLKFEKPASYTTTAKAYDGTTLLSRFDYFAGPHGVLLSQGWYYPNPSLSAYDSWAYAYSGSYDYAGSAKAGTGYEYNAAGRVTKTWIGGVYYRYEYPVGGGLYPIKKYGPGTVSDTDKGPMTEYTYDSSNRVTNVKPPNMGSLGITYTYDSQGRVTQVTNPAGDHEHFVYDSRGNMTSHTDNIGNAWTYAYDDLGRMTSKTAPGTGNQTTSYTYTGSCSSCGGAAGLVDTITTPDNQVTHFTYDANGNRTSMTDAENRTATYTYDNMNHVTTVTTPDGRVQAYGFNKLGRMISSTAPDGAVTKFEYDYRGLLTKTWLENDPNTTVDDDILVRNEYDTAGRLTKVTDAKNQIIVYTYNSRGQVTKTTHGNSEFDANPGKMFINNTYDVYGRLIKTAATNVVPNPDDTNVDPVEYFYDNTKGQLTKKRYTNAGVAKDVDYYYDNLGRPNRVDDWMGDTSNDGHHFAYDANGNVTTYTDFDDKTLTQVPDEYGRPSSMTAYEAGNTQSYVYDNMGRLTTLTAPGNRQWGFSYNNVGQPTAYTWPNGMSTVYTYDTAGRLTKIEHKDGTAVKAGWTYDVDKADQILRIGDAKTTPTTTQQAWEYGYDTRKRLVHALRLDDNGAPQLRMDYAYDTGDNMTSSTKLNLNAAVRDTFVDGNYTASPAWTVVSGTWSAATYALVPVPASGAREMYTANTSAAPDVRLDYYQPTSVNWGDGFTLYLRYASATNFLSLEWGLGCLMLVQRVNGVDTQLGAWVASEGNNSWYTVYAQLRGNTVSLYHGKQAKGLKMLARGIGISTTMTTTQLRLLVDGVSAFKFDNADVRTPVVDVANATTYAYNDANQLTSSVTNGATTTYTYDRWGRLATRSVGTYSATYGWRFGDKLKSVTSTIPGESASVAYNYDGLGKRRCKQVNGGGLTWWRWGLGWETLAQYNDANTDWTIEGFAQFNVVKDFMHPLAEATLLPGQTPPNGSYGYLALDHLSNARAVFNQSKTQTGSMEFYPYGQRLSTSGTLPYNQFTAKPYDTEDGLYYFPYRYYRPAMDRWISADPLGTVDGPNVYGYVNGQALRHADAKGLTVVDIMTCLGGGWACKALCTFACGCSAVPEPLVLVCWFGCGLCIGASASTVLICLDEARKPKELR
jgi:RHS repeat-associated protein